MRIQTVIAIIAVLMLSACLHKSEPDNAPFAFDASINDAAMDMNVRPPPACVPGSERIDIGDLLSPPFAKRIYDVTFTTDGIVVLYRVNKRHHLRKFARDGRPLTDSIEVLSILNAEEDSPGNVSIQGVSSGKLYHTGEELLISAIIDGRAFVGKVSESLNMTPQLTPLHDLRDEGGPIEASNPQIGLLGQNLLASWDDKRFIDANGWSQTQRTVRARYVAPDGGLGTESILTPLLPYGPGRTDNVYKIENGALVYPVSTELTSGLKYNIAFRALPRDGSTLEYQDPILFARIDRGINHILVTNVGEAPAIAWLDGGYGRELFYREQPNEYARGTMLSENAVLAQFVHDDDEPILVWANEMRSLGRTDLEWYTRAFGATDSVRYEVSVTEGEVEFFRARLVNGNAIETVTIHVLDSYEDTHGMWITTICP